MFQKKQLLQPEIESNKEKDKIKIFDSLEELDPYTSQTLDNQNVPVLDRLSKFLLIYGSSIIVFCFSLFLVCFLTLIFKQNITSIQFYIGILLTLLFSLWSAKKLDLTWTFGLGAFILMVLSGIVSILVSRQFYDLSYDGQTYLGEAVLEIADGWNPLYSKAPGYNNLHGIWLDNYPKLTWLNQTAIFKLTSNWEDIKFFSLIIFLASCSITFVTTSLFKLNIFQRFVCTLALVCSPLVVLQFNGLFLDGQMSSLLLIIISQFFLCYFYPNKFNLFSLGASIIVFENTKTAGLIYAIIAITVYFIVIGYNSRKSVNKIIKSVLISFVLGSFIFGFNPYVVNTIQKKNPVYPSLDKKAFDYTENTPKNYLGKSNIEIFTSAIFFKTDSDFSDTKYGGAIIKPPFAVSQDEVEALRIGAIKKGGLGPLFSGAFVVGLMTVAIALYYSIKKSKKNDSEIYEEVKEFSSWQIYAIISGTIILSCVLTSTSNTFRYIPQLWLLLGFSLIFAYSQKKFITSSMASLMAIIMFVNIGYCAYGNWIPQFSDTKKTAQILEKARESSKIKPLRINFGYQTTTRQRLEAAGVKYEEIVGSMDCETLGGWRFLPQNESQVCTK
jgi:hypothetical protein